MAEIETEVLITNTLRALEAIRKIAHTYSKELGVLGDELSGLRITTQVLSAAIEHDPLFDRSGIDKNLVNDINYVCRLDKQNRGSDKDRNCHDGGVVTAA